MKHDMRKFIPDVSRILRETHPDAVRERRRKALEGLREAGLIDRLTPTPVPRAEDAEPCEVPQAATEKKAEAQRRRTRAVFIGFAVLAVVTPAIVLLAGRVKAPREQAAVTAATASAPATVAVMVAKSAGPEASAGPVPVAVPVASEAPSVVSAAPVPSSAPRASGAPSGARAPRQPRYDAPAADAGTAVTTNKPEPGQEIW
jgi:hypothetical protein